MCKSSAHSSQDHPRSRGEHTADSPAAITAGGSSPLTRGARAILRTNIMSDGIIPAHAGSTRALGSGGGVPWDHPRSRGEHAAATTVTGLPQGSSPLTRGALMWLSGRGVSTRIIPAHAGSTKQHLLKQQCNRDHPRSRGEHPPVPPAPSLNPGSSPLTRGAQCSPSTPSNGGRIIPAHAGST